MSKPEPTQIDPSTVAVTGNFQLTAQLPQGKSISISGYLYHGEAAQSISQRIDVLHDEIDRQRTRAEIPEIEVKLEQSLQRLSDIKTHYAIMEAKVAKGTKLNQQEKAALEVRDVNIEKHKEDIERGRAAIAEAKAKLVIK